MSEDEDHRPARTQTIKGLVTLARDPNYIEGKHGAAMGTSIEEHLKDCKRCTAALGGIGNVARFEADAATFDLRAGHSNR